MPTTIPPTLDPALSNGVAIGPHLLSDQQLHDSVARMIGELPKDRTWGLGYAATTEGTGMALLWNYHPEKHHWELSGAAAVTTDLRGHWSGGVMGKITG